MSIKTKAILSRFLKVFIFGFASSAIMATAAVPTNWLELYSALTILAVSGIYGGMTALFAAIQKWYSWKDEDIIL